MEFGTSLLRCHVCYRKFSFWKVGVGSVNNGMSLYINSS